MGKVLKFEGNPKPKESHAEPARVFILERRPPDVFEQFARILALSFMIAPLVPLMFLAPPKD